MDRTVTNLMKLTRNELHNVLLKQQLPPALRTATIEKIMQAKAELRAKRIKQKVHNKLWRELLRPLKAELSNARVGLRLKSFEVAPERHLAFSEYVKLLEKLTSGLEVLRLDGETPKVVARLSGRENSGEHWSDWVSAKTKERIVSLFNAMPYLAKAKRFEPFKRRGTPCPTE